MGPESRVVGIIDAGQAVELADQAELRRLLFRRNPRGRGQERDRRPGRADIDKNAGVFGPQILRPIILAAAAPRRAFSTTNSGRLRLSVPSP